jgi:hypothetical protein
MYLMRERNDGDQRFLLLSTLEPAGNSSYHNMLKASVVTDICLLIISTNFSVTMPSCLVGNSARDAAKCENSSGLS